MPKFDISIDADTLTELSNDAISLVENAKKDIPQNFSLSLDNTDAQSIVDAVKDNVKKFTPVTKEKPI